MPYVIAARPQDLDRGPGAALAGVGRRVSQLSTEFARIKAAENTARRRDQLENRRLDIAELVAKQKLLRESNLTAAREAKAAQAEAAQQASLQAGQEFVQQGVAQRARPNLEAALASPGGVLGPFGMLNPRMLGQMAQRQAQTAATLGQKAELAARMSPEAARGYLTREAGKEKKAILAEGYARALESVQDAQADGVFTPQEAKTFTNLLQTAAAKGKDPGEIQTRIAKRYDLHTKLTQRAGEWEKADAQAQEMLGALEQLIGRVGGGVDPNTGLSPQDQMRERLGKAQAEWGRTAFPSFRMKTDPGASLAGLQKLLVEGQAVGDPMAPQRGTNLDVSRAPTIANTQRGAPPRQTGQGGIPNLAEGTLTKRRGQPSPRGTKPMSREDIEGALRNLVTQNARVALTVGAGREGMRKLVQTIAANLGVEVLPPEVLAIVRDELDKIRGPGSESKETRASKQRRAAESF